MFLGSAVIEPTKIALGAGLVGAAILAQAPSVANQVNWPSVVLSLGLSLIALAGTVVPIMLRHREMIMRLRILDRRESAVEIGTDLNSLVLDGLLDQEPGRIATVAGQLARRSADAGGVSTK